MPDRQPTTFTRLALTSWSPGACSAGGGSTAALPVVNTIGAHDVTRLAPTEQNRILDAHAPQARAPAVAACPYTALCRPTHPFPMHAHARHTLIRVTGYRIDEIRILGCAGITTRACLVVRRRLGLRRRATRHGE